MAAWPRQFRSNVVVGSPALAAETVVGQVAVTTEGASDIVTLDGWFAMTIGTSGTGVRLRIRRDSLIGTVVSDTGATAVPVTAATNAILSSRAVDQPGDVASQVYVLTVAVTAGAAASTVNTLVLAALVQSN